MISGLCSWLIFRGISTNRFPFSEKLIMGEVESEPLGMITVLFSPVSNMVSNILMAATVPVKPWVEMVLPTWKGLKTKRRIPPAKLARLPCSAKPMASPAAPKMATNEVVCMPMIPAQMTRIEMFNPTLIREMTNGFTSLSIELLSTFFSTIRVNFLMKDGPKSTKRMAKANLPP
jgi:hypothetical protein